MCAVLEALNKHCGVVLTLSHMTAVRHTLITSAEIITLIYFGRVYAVRPVKCRRSAISTEVTAIHARASANMKCVAPLPQTV